MSNPRTPNRADLPAALSPTSATALNTRSTDSASLTRWKRVVHRLASPKSAFTVTRDDRGKALPASSIDVATLRTLKPGKLKWNSNIDGRMVLPLILGISAFNVGVAMLTPHTGHLVANVISSVTGVVIARCLLWYLSRDGLTQFFFMGNMLKAARCPCCAYGLLDLEPAEDGCAACPECGAAWHTDRWKGSQSDAKQLLARTLDAGMSRALLRVHMDDRGVHVRDGTRWKCPWHAEVLRLQRSGTLLDPQMESFSRAAWQLRDRVLRRSFRNLSVWVLLIAVSVFVVADDVTQRALAFMIAILGIAGVFLFVATNSDHSVPLRGIALDHSLCPSCGEMLDLTQPRQFDGCIQCVKCAAAWRVAPTSDRPGVA